MYRMTLVLLSSFNDSEESIAGFTLCRKLAEEGSNLYVTTTSTGELLQREFQKVEEINSESEGSIILLEPEAKGPSDAIWIIKHHKKYFPYLQELPDVQTIIGLLPGTEQTALELKEALKCSLKLFAFSKIEAKGKEQENLRMLFEEAEEIWTLGSQIHSFYQQVLQNLQINDETLKVFSFQPFIEKPPWMKSSSMHKVKSEDPEERNIVSVWRNPSQMYQFRRETQIRRSNVESFVSLSLAMREIQRTNWLIHRLKSEDGEKLKEEGKSHGYDPSTLVLSEDDVIWEKCSFFIDPDVKDESVNFATFTAISLGIPTFVSSQTTVGKFLLELNNPVVNRSVVHLTGDVSKDKDIWKEKLSTETQEANPIQWAKKLRKQIEKALLPWELGSTNVHQSMRTGTILVLLHSFSESQESCFGYQLCQRLVKEGCQLLVSTTSSGKKLEFEIKKAKWLTDNSSGSITLLEPHYGEQEEPSVQWIEHPGSQQFFYLSQLKNVLLIVGALPGTSQTSVNLKEMLGCNLVLLASAKIHSNADNLNNEICRLAEKADEIWSVGNDTHAHFQKIFEELIPNPSEKHKEILLMPWVFARPDVKTTIETSGLSIISVWSKSVPFFYAENHMFVDGSDIDNFSTVSVALEKIGKELRVDDGTDAISWHIHGLTYDDTKFKFLESHSKQNTLKIKPQAEITSVNDVSWKKFMVFIAPDVVDNNLNFFALCAIWLGIPTLVSSRSSIGKFLLSLSCPAKSRALVTLTGQSADDTNRWSKKIYESILDKEAKPKEWAKELSEYIQTNFELWDVDLTTLKRKSRRRHPSSSCAPFLAEEDDKSTASESSDLQRSQERRKRSLQRSWSLASRQTSRSGNASTVSTRSSSSLSLDLDYSTQHYEFRECHIHTKLANNLFCRDCNKSICSRCKLSSHRNHATVPLVEKVLDDSNALTAFLSEGGKRATEVKNKEMEINEFSKKLLQSSSNVEQQVKEQYEYVRKELEEAYREEIEDIRRQGNRDMSKLTEQSKELRKFSQKWNNIKESGEALIKEVGSSDFIEKFADFLQDNTPIVFPDVTEKNVKKMQYTEPIYKQTGEGEEFRTYLRKHILGSVIPTRSPERSSLSSNLRRSQSSPVKSYSPRLQVQKSDINMTRLRRNPDHSSIAPNMKIRADLISYVSVGKTGKLHRLKKVFDASFIDKSMWISGWHRDAWGADYTAFYNIQVPENTVLRRDKMRDPQGDQAVSSCPVGNSLLFAKKDGSQLFRLYNHQFSPESDEDVMVTAMCSSSKYIYIFDRSHPRRITIFDHHFHMCGTISTGFANTENSDIGLCSIEGQPDVMDSPRSSKSADQNVDTDTVILLSLSLPIAAVRAVNQVQGILWQLDYRTCPYLDLNFNPCSVSASDAGDIFIADRGTDRIYTMSNDGTNLSVLLKERIHKPVQVRVDREGRNLLLITNDGTEIMNYTLNMQRLSRADMGSTSSISSVRKTRRKSYSYS